MDPLEVPTDESQPEPAASPVTIVVGRVAELPPGRSLSLGLPDGSKVAVYNVAGEFFATDNSCPHHGWPLAEGTLCSYVIECGLHGWQFDVRNGQCLTVSESITTYRVVVEDGVIKLEL